MRSIPFSTVIAYCQYRSISKSNIHYMHMHTGMMDKLKAYKSEMSVNSNSVSKSKQTKMCHSTTDHSKFIKNCSKQKITDLVFNYIVEEMKPISTCEKPSFKALVTGLSNNNFVPDRRAIKHELLNKYKEYVNDLTETIVEQRYVCITTDIWSSLNKSYLGMTLHYIVEKTFQRFSYALVCRRIEGSHNYINIAKCITEIMKCYKINISKISHTVTDNASNFGKAFRVYAQQFRFEESCHKSTIKNKQALNDKKINKLIDELNIVDPDFLQNEYIEDEPSDISIKDVSNILSVKTLNDLNKTDEFFEEIEDIDIVLSDHITCSAHTLNLVATVDSKITDSAYKKISRSTFGKLTSFWNLLNRSSLASDKIFDICQCKFPLPVITRWNLFYDAIKKIFNCREKVIESFDELKIFTLKPTEWKFIEEYIVVMEPLTIALDKLQGEKSCYLGYIVLTIIALKRILISKSNLLLYCEPLSINIIMGIERRFYFIFNLNDSKSKPYILATMSHPKFKLNWVSSQDFEMCKNVFFSECNKLSSIMNIESEQSTSDHDSGDKLYSSLISSCSQSTNSSSGGEQASIQGLSFLNYKKKDGTDLNILDS